MCGYIVNLGTPVNRPPGSAQITSTPVDCRVGRLHVKFERRLYWKFVTVSMH